MDVRSFALVLFTASCMAGANVLLKSGLAQTGGLKVSLPDLMRLARQPAFLGGVLLTGIAAVVWFHILATEKLSTCYPVFVSLTYCLITLAAVYVLHERVSAQKLAGLAVIVLGITVVARG